VSLAALSEPATLPARIAEAMRLVLADGTVAALVSALVTTLGPLADEANPRWLVLDNAEHLVDAVARVADALADVPGLHLLVTSQVPLGMPGEAVLRLPTLAVPAEGAAVDAALTHGAIALFAERARAADRRFGLTPERVPAVVEICRRLDGLPLALEMAAARLPLLGLDGLRRSLDERFHLLVRPHGVDEPRHPTLKAALDWSHDQLDEPERRVLRRCAVFIGGFSLELMVAVAGLPAAEPEASGDRWETVDALGRLVARSLVITEGFDMPRYRLLETVRAYAAQRLQAAGEDDATARRHAEALRDFFAAERRRVRDGQPVSESMPRCTPEFDNLDRAVDWCLAHEPALAVELVAQAGIFTVHSLRRRDAERWLAACEPHEHHVADPELRGEYLLELTRARVMKGDPAAADAARRALAVFAAAGHELGEFRALGALLRGAARPDAELDRAALRLQELAGRHPEWPVAYHMGNTGALARWAAINRRFAEALALRREEAEWAARAGNPMMQRAALSNTIHMLGRLGRHDEAVAVGEALRQALQGQADQSNRAYTCLFLANSLTALGRLDEATRVALEGEALMRTLDLPLMGPLLALLAARRGWPRQAARLAGWALVRYEARKLPLQEDAQAQYDEAVQVARAALGDVALALQLAQGRLLRDQAVPTLLQAGHDVALYEVAGPATGSRVDGDR
jgi:predicted ATPase